MPLEPGQLVTPQVRLVRLLKAGGMGSVWVADQLGLKTEVAVKFIQGDHAHKPELAARFAREAMAAARIKSPHVVQIHDHGLTDAGDPYMVMELLEGEDLATRIRRDGAMRLEDIARVVQQVCRVLAKAHAQGIVHRDIKPSNIFVVDDSPTDKESPSGASEADAEIFVKILDFGVAKVKQDDESDLTGTGAMMGTMVYMSPEQLLDARNVDFRADLWSLAVATYYAIAGSRPFTDDNGVGALVLALDRGQYEPITKMRAGLSPALDDWFAHAFRRKPEERFASAKDMANELLAAIGSKETLAMLQASSTALPRISTTSLPEIILPPPERAASQPGKRRPKLLLFAAAIGAAVAIAAIGFSIAQSSRSDAAPLPTAKAEPTAIATTEPPASAASTVDEPAPSVEEPTALAPSTSASAVGSAPFGKGPLHGPRPKSTSEKDYGF